MHLQLLGKLVSFALYTARYNSFGIKTMRQLPSEKIEHYADRFKAQLTEVAYLSDYDITNTNTINALTNNELYSNIIICYKLIQSIIDQQSLNNKLSHNVNTSIYIHTQIKLISIDLLY